MRRHGHTKLYLIVLSVLLFVVSSLRADESPPTDVLLAADEQYAQGYWRRAEEALLELLTERDRELPAGLRERVLERLIRICTDSGKVGDALGHALERHKVLQELEGVGYSVQSRSDNTLTLVSLYTRLNQPDEAIRWWGALPEDSTSVDADFLFRRAEIAVQLATCLDLQDDQPNTQRWWTLALRDCEKSIGVWQHASQHAADCVEAASLRFPCYRALDDTAGLEQAVRELEAWAATQESLARVEVAKVLANTFHGLRRADEERAQLALCVELLSKLPSAGSAAEKLQRETELAEAHSQLAFALLAADNPTEAAVHWQHAATLYEAGLSAKPDAGDSSTPALRLRQLQGAAIVYQRLGRFAEGRERAEELVRLAQSTLDDSDPTIHRAKNTLGSFLSLLRDYRAAAQLLHEVCGYWEASPEKDPEQHSSTLNNLAVVRREQGQFTESLHLLQSSLALCQKHFDVDDVRTAEVRVNLAAILAARGQYASAIEHYREAIRVCEQWKGGLSSLHSTALLNLAMTYRAEGQLEAAIRYCEEALTLCMRQTSDKSRLLPHYLALAGLHLAKGSPVEAEMYVLRCEEICAMAGSAADAVRARVAYQSALLRYLRDDLAGARERWQDALATQQGVNQPVLEIKTMSYLAEIAYRENRIADAVTIATQALDKHETLNVYPKLHYTLFYNRARALYRLGNLDEAISSLDHAVELIETPRSEVFGASRERAEFFAMFAPAFDLLVQWCIEAGRVQDALYYAEISRNRTFLDELRTSGVDFRQSLRGTVREYLLDNERQALTQLTNLERRIEALLHGADDEKTHEQLVAELIEARATFVAARNDVYMSSTIYREMLDSQGLSKDTFAPRDLLREDEAILQYYVGKRHSYAVLVLPEGAGGESQVFAVELFSDGVDQVTPLSHASLAALVRDFIDQVTIDANTDVRRRGSEELDAPYAHSSGALSSLSRSLLPKKLVKHIKAARIAGLYIVPDGPLQNLPFEALPLDGKSKQYLLDDSEFPLISYVPSLSILEILQNRSTTEDIAIKAELLAVGNPDYDSADTGNAQDRSFDMRLPALPSTAVEIQRAVAAFGPDRTTRIEGVDATERDVRSQLSGHRIVHLAAHALVERQQDNLFGLIALTRRSDRSDPANDGYLRLHELQTHSILGCELAVLSACNTNVGPSRPLESGSTFARAFLGIGARRVVCSFWGVADESTAELIGSFLESLAHAPRGTREYHYARSLHAARLAIRNNEKHPEWSAPYYWAPFVLVGPPR